MISAVPLLVFSPRALCTKCPARVLIKISRVDFGNGCAAVAGPGMDLAVELGSFIEQKCGVDEDSYNCIEN